MYQNLYCRGGFVYPPARIYFMIIGYFVTGRYMDRPLQSKYYNPIIANATAIIAIAVTGPQKNLSA
jgi:uncharacterized protein YneF (UPF0154 family)